MPTTCKIHFDTNVNIFHPGQKLGITVRLRLTEKKKFRDISIQLCRETHVHFMEDGKSCIANDNVLDMKKYLVPGIIGEIQHLMPGTYDYSFQCTLPHNLPSSFSSSLDECGLGHTKYTAQVIINIPLWPYKTFKKEFIVYKSLDLNDSPVLQNSITVQKEVTVELIRQTRQIYHTRCDDNTYLGGPFNILAHIDYGGYVPGQTINVECEIDNNDPHHEIVRFRAKLLRKVTFFKSENSKHRKTTFEILAKKNIKEGCKQGQRKTFTVPLFIRKTPPTDTESKLIKIEYEIRILGWMGHWQEKHPSISIPITIGTKPIVNSIPTVKNIAETVPASVSSLLNKTSNAYFFEGSASQQPDDDTVSVRTYTSTPPPFPDDELDLPNYDEAMVVNLDDDFDVNLEHTQHSFAQLYKKQ